MDSDLHEIFMNRFKKLLAERKLSAYAFMTELGWSHGIIRGWTVNRSLPSVEKLNQISDYFDVSLDYLLGKDNTVQEKNEDYYKREMERAINVLKEIGLSKEAEKIVRENIEYQKLTKANHS